MGEAQLNATAASVNHKIPENLITDLKYILAEEIEVMESQNLSEQRMRLETHKKMQTQRKTEFYNNKISTQENIIKKGEKEHCKYTSCSETSLTKFGRGKRKCFEGNRCRSNITQVT